MLDKAHADVADTRLSKKQPLSDADARQLLSRVEEVVIAKGKKSRTLTAGETSLDDLRGPTGGFRAPMLIVGKRLLVGFQEEILRGMLSGS